MASTQRIVLIENTDQAVNFTITDKDGNAINLNGLTIRFAAKQRRNDVDADKLFDVLCVVTDAAAGECRADIAGTTVPKGFRGGLAELSIWNVLSPGSGQLPDERAIFKLDIQHSVISTGYP